MIQLAINRFGQIQTNAQDNFQCKVKGHPTYHYHVRIVCDNKLDRQGFLIDHVEIDRCIQLLAQAPSIDSCEILANRILRNVREVLKVNGVGYSRIEITIKPDLNPAAFMELIFTKD